MPPTPPYPTATSNHDPTSAALGPASPSNSVITHPSSHPFTDHPAHRPPIHTAADLFLAIGNYPEITSIVYKFWEGEPSFVDRMEKSLAKFKKAVDLMVVNQDQYICDRDWSPTKTLLKASFVDIVDIYAKGSTIFELRMVLEWLADAFAYQTSHRSTINHCDDCQYLMGFEMIDPVGSLLEVALPCHPMYQTIHTKSATDLVDIVTYLVREQDFFPALFDDIVGRIGGCDYSSYANDHADVGYWMLPWEEGKVEVETVGSDGKSRRISHQGLIEAMWDFWALLSMDPGVWEGQSSHGCAWMT